MKRPGVPGALGRGLLGTRGTEGAGVPHRMPPTFQGRSSLGGGCPRPSQTLQRCAQRRGQCPAGVGDGLTSGSRRQAGSSRT